MNQFLKFINELNIVSGYAFYSLCVVFSIIFIYYVYYWIVIKPKDDKEIEYLLRKYPNFTTEDAVEYMYPSNESSLKKVGTASSFAYLIIAYLMSIIAFPLSFYIYEYYLLSINPIYLPTTSVTRSLSFSSIFVLIVFDLVICLFIILFLCGAIINLLKKNDSL